MNRALMFSLFLMLVAVARADTIISNCTENCSVNYTIQFNGNNTELIEVIRNLTAKIELQQNYFVNITENISTKNFSLDSELIAAKITEAYSNNTATFITSVGEAVRPLKGAIESQQEVTELLQGAITEEKDAINELKDAAFQYRKLESRVGTLEQSNVSLNEQLRAERIRTVYVAAIVFMATCMLGLMVYFWKPYTHEISDRIADMLPWNY